MTNNEQEYTFTNPFRVALDEYERRQKDLTYGERVFWFDTFWDEWDDSTHDGNTIFSAYAKDGKVDVEREVDFDNRIQFLHELLLDGKADDIPYFTDDPEQNRVKADEHLAHELRVMKVAAEIVDRIVNAFPEIKSDPEPFVSSRTLRDSIEEAMKDPGSYWKSVVIEFEMGPGPQFERVLRGTVALRELEGK